jgi:NSS family neurotransmitter:Na+ symporter
MRKLAGVGNPWVLIGWLGVLSAFMILSYAQVIMGWVIAYMIKVGTGQFAGSSRLLVAQAYDRFVSAPGPVLLYTALQIALLGAVVTRGVQKGIERANRIVLPFRFVLLVLLAIGGLTLPGAMAGVRWYLWPDLSRLDAGAVLAALGQVFYSIGVGMAGAFVYGSYLHPRESDVPGGAATVAASVAFASFLSGLVMFPALFAFGLEPNVGPGLLFVTMASLFAVLPAGSLLGGLFFFLVFLAGFTASIGLLEALTASVMDSLGLRRNTAVWLVLVFLFAAAIPSALSFGPWAGLHFFGLSVFGLIDFVSGNLFLGLGALLLSLYTARAWGFEAFQRETNVGAKRVRVFDSWRPFVNYLIPLAVVVVLLAGLGVL